MSLLALAALSLALAPQAPTGPAHAAPRAAGQDSALLTRLREQLDREARSLEGVSVAVAVGDELLLAEGRGYVDAAAGRRAGADSRWRAGALYPTLAALCALEFVQEGRLSLGDPLTRFLPALELDGERVELRHLLAHTSGLPSYVAWHEAGREDTPVDPPAVVAWLARQPLDFHPGHCFSWSNSNALLTGMVVEQVSGEPLAQRIEQTLFEPLEMDDSGFGCEGVPMRRAIHATYEVAGTLADDCHAMLPFGAEALCTSAPDLVKLMRGLAARRVVDEAIWEALLTAVRGDDGEQAPWSLGVGLVTLDGRPGLVLGGGFGGARAHVAHYPRFDLTVAVLAAGCEAPVGDVERRLARIVMSLPEPGLHDLPLSPETMGTYVGDYYLGCSRLVIFPRKGSLWLGAPQEPDVRLRYQGADVFVRDDDTDVRLEFRVEDARAHAFLYVARGAQSVARRIDGGARASPHN